MTCVDASPWTWIQILVRLFWDIRDFRVGHLGRTLFDLRRARKAGNPFIAHRPCAPRS